VSERRARRVLAAAIVLGVGVRLALLATAAHDPSRLVTTDGGGYLALARDLRGGYLDPTSPVFRIGLQYPPGYPLFAGAVLRLVGDSIPGLCLVQVGVVAATLALLFGLGRRLLGGPDAAALAALLVALDPASAFYSVVSQPEAVFTGLVVAAALAWTRAQQSDRWAAAAGLLVGAATWVRPIGLGLPLALAATTPALVGRGRRARAAVLLLVPALLFAGGWMARNKRLTGEAFFAGIGSANGLYYRAAGALAVSEGIPIEVARDRLKAEEVRRGANRVGPGERVRLQEGLMREVMLAHPLGAARAAVEGWVRLFTGSGLTALSVLIGDPDPESVTGAERLTGVALALPNAIVLLGALLAALRARRDDWPLLALCGAVLLYLVAASSFLEANTRFRVPMAPFLALLAARGWTRSLARFTATGGARPPAPRP
jgi:4-amino-4-deoxy-L-arabinose transferase-like glycosyltransferase